MLNIQAVLIAGPTASGKSGLAVEVAKALNGAVINADSMQVYDVLSLLTARPDAGEMAGVEHVLYGHIPPSDAYSVAKYLEDVAPVLSDLRAHCKMPVFTGGTGLYFKALLDGLSSIPPIDPEIRADIRDLSQTDLPALYDQLTLIDPEGARRLEPGDSQRICRALEVVKSTGKPLSWWQSQRKVTPLLESGRCLKIVLMPERPALRDRIARRFNQMVEQGALDEVRRFLELNLSGDLPAMRAIGVQHLGEYLAGKMTLDEAKRLAITATHQYAKRQSTWFRNQFFSNSEGEPGVGWQCVTSPKEALEQVLKAVKMLD